MIGMPKAEVDPIVLEEVRTGKAGAIIYFEKNIPANKLLKLYNADQLATMQAQVADLCILAMKT